MREVVVELRLADRNLRHAEAVSDAVDALDALTAAAEAMGRVGERPGGAAQEGMWEILRQC